MTEKTTHETRLGLLRLPHGMGLELPSYATAGAAGLDLRTAFAEGDEQILQPMARILVPTGFTLEIPAGFEGQIRPRSGLALKYGITLVNTPGTIDWDYRGEIKVLLINFGSEPFSLTRGLRIAQLVIAPVIRVVCNELVQVTDTTRGGGGFGSTGVA